MPEHIFKKVENIMNNLSWKHRLAILFFVVEGITLFGSIISGDFALTLGGPIYGQFAYFVARHIFLILGLLLWFVGKRK